MARYRIPAFLEVDAENEKEAIDCAYNTMHDRFESYELTNDESPEVTYWYVMNSATEITREEDLAS
jgi:hypothetical protein